MKLATDESVPEREGLQAALVLGTWSYLVLIASHFLVDLPVPWQVWLNRIGSLVLFLSVYRRFSEGRIARPHIVLWTFGLSIWTVTSVCFSYVYGASPHIAARIAFLMVVAAVLGLSPRLHILLLTFGVASTVFLQLCYPSPSDPGLNLLPAFLCGIFSVQAHRTRRGIFQSLSRAQADLQIQAGILADRHQQAARRQASLDADVAHATRDLEETNRRLSQAIDDQIEGFHQNQKLRQETAELLYSQSLGRAAGSAAHDFNNLLGVISATLEFHEADLCEQAASRAAYETIRAEVDRAMVVGRRVLAVSGRQILRPERVDLKRLLPEWVKSWSAFAPHLRLLFDDQASAVLCDPAELRQMLEALVWNAVEASVVGAEVTLRVQPGGVILVEDQGAGVPEHLLSNLFKPFFTTHSDALHQGLSLAAVRAVLRQQGGEISYETEPRPHFRIQLEPQ
ncbi:hypothetical protein JST97_24255 [bacterium]|nr:hypothetical protein [bacterium]